MPPGTEIVARENFMRREVDSTHAFGRVRDHHPFKAGDPGHCKKDCFILKYICVVF
jgi:hypothetical protein